MVPPDRLTQLQTTLDQLVVQFFSSLSYVNSKHDFVSVKGEPKVSDAQLEPDTPEVFEKSLQELAKDIAVKSKQIELLIDSLPGLNVTEAEQLDEIVKLDQELQRVRAEKTAALDRRRDLLQQCNNLIVQITKEKAELQQASEPDKLK